MEYFEFIENFIGNPKFATPVEGLYYDFNEGPRLLLPEGNFDITYIDRGYDTVLCHKSVSGKQRVWTEFCDYVDWEIRIKKNGKEICTLHQDLRGKNVLVDLIGGSLGDAVVTMVIVEKFRVARQCSIHMLIKQEWEEIFRRAYPKINFVVADFVHKDAMYKKFPDNIYAAYRSNLFFKFIKNRRKKSPWPVDFRVVGTINHLLVRFEIDDIANMNKLIPSSLDESKRTIKEPYVCISGRASEIFKEWNNENGWAEVTKYLRKLGYRVICIDGSGIENGSPLAKALEAGMEDFTGYKPLQERVDLLYYADFFIGLPSGLSWLAWGTGKKVIMVGGFALPKTDFYTPYKVINYDVCHGCINDPNLYECIIRPCYETEHYLECSKFIFPEMVCRNIDKLMADNHLLPPVARESRV